MAVRLHTCPFPWLHMDGHACWVVEQALRESGVAYEIAKEPGLPRSRRKAIIAATGQQQLPVIERADGTWWRDESKVMAEQIRGGALSAGGAQTD